MNSNNKKNYVYWMFAIFGAIALNIVLFFLIFRFREFGGSHRKDNWHSKAYDLWRGYSISP